MSTKKTTYTAEEELEFLLEAARRANWDALHGPVHLRTGRFRPEQDYCDEDPAGNNEADDDQKAPTTDNPDPSPEA